ncbi:MAG TPA: hypothetical protein VKR31_01595 [Rhizomicrobium sp.]|nr:hypothetical protein [Rhizomicrobium sp.]
MRPNHAARIGHRNRRRHVREGEAHVARHGELIEELRVDGHDTRRAEELLTEFEAVLVEHKKHLEVLRTRQHKCGSEL